MKENLRKIAIERMEILINNAISNSRHNPELSEKQANLARKISTRYKIRMPYFMKMVFCKKCKSFICPGLNSTIRMGGSQSKSIRITCRFCGHTYRKIIVNDL